MLDKQSTVIAELQLITGVMADDVEYLVYSLLKDGSYFNKIKQEGLHNEHPQESSKEQSTVADWFSKLKEV